jgi:DNA-binding XRE family transcriptional regulator
MAHTLYKLQYLRKRAGLTQEQMAARINMTVHGYRKIEQGARGISLETAIKIKNTLGASHVEDVFEDAG